MTSDDLYTALHYLSRVTVRGFEEEQELVELVAKIKSQIMRSNQITNVYTDGGTKVA